ncbi:MAG: tetratricopeptide repeat protein [Pyrinomonadaceae bacterium MAG19_C2-C3]|nr:tetratricopeptide repeat protein [Pyrinomonadaceae bacterium MAG19_C2-C3]
MKFQSQAIIFLCALLCQVACSSNAVPPGETNTAPSANVVAEATPAAVTGDVPPPNDEPLPSDARGFFELGVRAFQNGDDRRAAEAFKQAITLEPDFAEAHLKLGNAYAVLGEREAATEAYEQAVKTCERLVRTDSKNAEAHFNLGIAQGKLGDYDESIKALKQAVKLDPEDAAKHYELGFAHSKVAQYKEAVAELKEALARDSENYRVRDLLEKAEADLKRQTASLKYLEQTEKTKLGKPEARQSNRNSNSTPNASPTPKPSPKTSPKASPVKP